jgi:uncharacterized protein (TIGR03435 family)
MRRWLLLFVFASPVLLNAQTPSRDQKPLAFEVASVKTNQSPLQPRWQSRGRTIRDDVCHAARTHRGRLSARRWRSRFDAEITGGPSWLNTEHLMWLPRPPRAQGVGIQEGNTAVGAATAAERSAAGQIREMVRPLLAERFKLMVHHEVRDLAAYELRVDRSDGRLGPQLKSVDVDCIAQRGSGQLCGGFRAITPGHIIGLKSLNCP